MATNSKISMPPRQGRPPRNLAQAQVRCDKERARKAKFVKCAECEFPNCSGWEENIDHPDPDNFGLVEEDTDMEDGLGQDLDDPPDSPRSCVRVRVVYIDLEIDLDL